MQQSPEINMNKKIFQVVRKQKNLTQLVGEYENIHRAKFIMHKASLHNNRCKYVINVKPA
jgi:hypothetical protein